MHANMSVDVWCWLYQIFTYLNKFFSVLTTDEFPAHSWYNGIFIIKFLLAVS